MANIVADTAMQLVIWILLQFSIVNLSFSLGMIDGQESGQWCVRFILLIRRERGNHRSSSRQCRVFARRKMLRLFLGFGVILSKAKHFLVIS